MIKKALSTHLTLREKQCIKELMMGKTIKEVAAVLDLSPRTVADYLTNARAKLACFNRSQLLRRVREEKLI